MEKLKTPAPPFQAVKLGSELWARWEAAYSAARLHLERGEHDAAVAQARAAWEMLPEPRAHTEVSVITNKRLVKTLGATGQVDAALVVLEDYIDKSPLTIDDGPNQVMKGILLFDSGQFEAARAAFALAWKASRKFGFRGEDPKYFEFYQRA
jgi:predicted negative regulator of RcsB-dependent stress response